MAKTHDEETLFAIPLETEEISVSDEISMKLPVTPVNPPATVAAQAPDNNIQNFMLSGDKPSLLAVDVQPGEIPLPNTIVQEKTVDTPPATIPPVVPPVVPAAGKQTAAPAGTPPVTTPTIPAAGTASATKDQGQQGGKDTNEENLSPMYLHASALLQEGVLPNLDLKTLDGLDGPALINKLIEESRKEVKDQAETLNEQYKNSLNEPQKQVMDMLGRGIPFDDAANIVYNQQRYGSFTPEQIKESPEIQEQVYREFLQAKGHKPEFIEQSVKLSKDLELLEKNSLDADTELKQMAKDDETAAIQLAADQNKIRETKNAEVLKSIKENVSKTTEIFAGVSLKPEDQKAILEYMTIPAAQVNRGGKMVDISKKEEIRSKNPMEFEKRLSYFIHLGLFDDKPTIPELVASGETTSVNKLAQILSSGPGAAGGTPPITIKDQKLAAGQEDQEIGIKLPGSINSVRHNE